MREFLSCFSPLFIGATIEASYVGAVKAVLQVFQSPLHWGNYRSQSSFALARGLQRCVSVPSSLGQLSKLCVAKVQAIICSSVSVPSSLGQLSKLVSFAPDTSTAQLFQSPLHWGNYRSLKSTLADTLAAWFQSPLHWGNYRSHRDSRVGHYVSHCFSPLFIGATIEASGFSASSINFRTCFSPLFIGATIEAGGEVTSAVASGIPFQSPLHWGNYRSRTCKPLNSLHCGQMRRALFLETSSFAEKWGWFSEFGVLAS